MVIIFAFALSLQSLTYTRRNILWDTPTYTKSETEYVLFCYPYRLHKRTRELGRSPSCKCPQQAQNPGPARRQAPGCATLHGMHTTESRFCLLFYVDQRITPLPPNRSVISACLPVFRMFRVSRRKPRARRRARRA